MYDNKDYKMVHNVEGIYGNHPFGMQILIDIKRDLTDTDKENIWKCAETLQKALMRETVKLDPKKQEEAAQERKDVLAVFGDRKIYVQDIPNGYCKEHCCSHRPWFMVTTPAGIFKIGWRKRVIEIEWDESLKNQIKDKDLFKDEDVTKADTYIHAWGYEKAKEYIDKLHSHL